MASFSYSDDNDLLKIAPKILSYGVTDWDDHHDRAADIINRILEQRFYRPEALHRDVDYETDPFNPSLLDADQLVWLSCYKVLEIAYQYLMKPGNTEDFYERQSKIYSDKFDQELQTLLSLGITYDWDEDDEFSEEERIVRQRRRLRRS